jgi:hypothetical protein
MKRGYIKLWRKIKDHDFWKENRSKTKFEAWVDLLMMAAGLDKKVLYRGEMIKVKRGQILTSKLSLSKQWGWDRKTVTRFIDLLKNEDQIRVIKKDNRYSILSICNYEKYNPLSDIERTTEGTTEGTTDAPTDAPTEGTTSKKDKRRNKEGINNTYADCLQKWNQFAEKHNLPQIIKITPRTRRGRALNARLKEGLNFDELLERIEEQPFLLGENKNGWAVDFDFIITASKYQKIIEGGYKRVHRDPAVDAKERVERVEKIRKRIREEKFEEEPY